MLRYRFHKNIFLKGFTVKIENEINPEAVVMELGSRIAQKRIDMGLTQAMAAKKAGICKRTLERIEAGADAKFITIIRLLRTLDLYDHLDQLVPEPVPSPIEMLKNRKKLRKRAVSKTRSTNKSEVRWKWGDEK
jgi:DNA-binding XRE family transcriptional regulator